MSKHNGVDETEYMAAKKYADKIENIVRYCSKIEAFPDFDLNCENRGREFIEKMKWAYGICQTAVDNYPNYDWVEGIYNKKFHKALELLA